jgi:hypothetical protein
MPIGPYVSGPALVKVFFRDGAGLRTLGYSADGIQVTENQHYGDIHSDRYGGQQGPPLDRQWFGNSAVIPLALSEFDPAVARLMRNLQFGTPPGITYSGCPLGADGKTFQLIISGLKDVAALTADPLEQTWTPLNYPNCFLSDPFELPVGAKHTILGLNIMALQFTSDVAAGGDGLTWLRLDRVETLVPSLAEYDATP